MSWIHWWGRVLLCTIALAASACGSGEDAGPRQPPQRDAGTNSKPDAGSGSCQINADCNVGVCNPATKRCVECVQNTDCAPGSTCTANACVEPPSCKTNSDCASASGKLCDLELGKCVECVGAANCPPEFDCDESRRCVASKTCKNSLDCNQGQVCDTPSSRNRSPSLGSCLSIDEIYRDPLS